MMRAFGGIKRNIFDILHKNQKIFAPTRQWRADFTSVGALLIALKSGVLPRLSPSQRELTHQSITFVDSLPRRRSKLLS
jgi:hypothetical protein